MYIKKIMKGFIRCSMWIGLALMCIFIIYGYKAGIFSDMQSLQDFIKGFGMWAAVIFLMIQIIQVIIPILPGGISCLIGVVIFGSYMGFLYNYIGICIGSILVFLISKKYGRPLVRTVIGEKAFNKYIGWVEHKKKFEKMFAIAIFFPVAPDDLLCYIAGLTKMELKKFTAIILLGKPMSIALYSAGLMTAGHFALSLVR